MLDLFYFIVGTLLTVCGALAVIVLNGIKGEIKEIKTSLSSLETDMRDGLSGLGHRVTILETKCQMNRDICGQ